MLPVIFEDYLLTSSHLDIVDDVAGLALFRRGTLALRLGLTLRDR